MIQFFNNLTCFINWSILSYYIYINILFGMINYYTPKDKYLVEEDGRGMRKGWDMFPLAS